MDAVDYSRPPVDETTPWGWARKNLFSTWYNAVYTVVFGAFGLAVVGFVGVRILGADVAILRVNLTNFMVGRYPRDELWRVATTLVVLAGLGGAVAGNTGRRARARAAETGIDVIPTTLLQLARRLWPGIFAVVVVLSLTTTITPTLLVLAAVAAAAGGYGLGRVLTVRTGVWVWTAVAVGSAGAYAVLAVVPWNLWGGWLVNLFLTVGGIALAFPFGLALALGRRSSLPSFRVLSISYIEIIRGVPLVTLLLMGIFVIGFFLPDFLSPGSLTRVLIAIVLFEAAYIAEVVRGGLQAVPHGQIEAAQALGLSPWTQMTRIVLPQALRATIPAMVGQFISLYKDTTLASIVGILELLSVSQTANAQPEFFGRGLHLVTLPFVGLLFWAGSYMMSREAGRLEGRLGVGER